MVNRAAQALGRLAKGKRKSFSPEYRKELSERIKAAQKKRVKQLKEKKES